MLKKRRVVVAVVKGAVCGTKIAKTPHGGVLSAGTGPKIGLMSSLTWLKDSKISSKVLGRARLRAAKIAKTRHAGKRSTRTDQKHRPNEFPDLAKRC